MTSKRRAKKTSAKKSRPRPRRPPTLWHLPFGALVEERCPKWIEVRLEELVQRESQRIDQLYILRALHPRDPADRGRVMRGLWPHIPKVGVGEYKSPAAPFRTGDLYRLIGCAWNWLHKRPEHAPADAVMVLITAAITDTIAAEITGCGAALAPLGDGYHGAKVGGLPLVVVELDTVSEAEKDDYLRAFSHHAVQTAEVVQWLRAHTNLLEGTVLDPKELAGKEDVIRKIAESIPVKHRLYGLTPAQREELLRELQPEERLSGLQPEERLSGLQPEQIARALDRSLSETDQVLALPDHLLRLLPASYLATLPADAQEKVRARLRTA